MRALWVLWRRAWLFVLWLRVHGLVCGLRVDDRDLGRALLDLVLDRAHRALDCALDRVLDRVPGGLCVVFHGVVVVVSLLLWRCRCHWCPRVPVW